VYGVTSPTVKSLRRSFVGAAIESSTDDASQTGGASGLAYPNPDASCYVWLKTDRRRCKCIFGCVTRGPATRCEKRGLRAIRLARQNAPAYHLVDADFAGGVKHELAFGPTLLSKQWLVLSW